MTVEQAPADVANLKSFYLISGIFNSIAVVASFFWLPLLGVATCGLGCVFVVVPAINLTAAVLDFISMSRITSSTGNPISLLRAAAIFDIVSGAMGSIVPVIMGILELVGLGKPDVQTFFASRASAPSQP